MKELRNSRGETQEARTRKKLSRGSCSHSKDQPRRICRAALKPRRSSLAAVSRPRGRNGIAMVGESEEDSSGETAIKISKEKLIATDLVTQTLE